MCKEYPILWKTQQVGEARVWQEGLYCRIECICSGAWKEMPRVQLVCGEKRVDLGICIPTAQGPSIHTRIAAKKIGEESLQFYIQLREPEPVIPLYPVTYLKHLPNVRLTKSAESMGLLLTDQAPAPPDNGQIP